MNAGPKRPEYAPKTTRQHLGYLIEECGESVEASAQCLEHGLGFGVHALVTEAEDLSASMVLLASHVDDVAAGAAVESGFLGDALEVERQRRLEVLARHLGRTLAAVGKSIRWGTQSTNPELPPEQRETNEAWLMRELHALHAEIGSQPARLRPPKAIVSMDTEKTTGPDGHYCGHCTYMHYGSTGRAPRWMYCEVFAFEQISAGKFERQEFRYVHQIPQRGHFRTQDGSVYLRTSPMSDRKPVRCVCIEGDSRDRETTPGNLIELPFDMPVARVERPGEDTDVRHRVALGELVLVDGELIRFTRSGAAPHCLNVERVETKVDGANG